MRQKRVALASILLATGLGAFAQNESAPQLIAPPSVPPQSREGSSAPEEPTVVESNGDMRTQEWFELNQSVTVALYGLRDWAHRGENNPNDLRLYLAGRMLPNSEPTGYMLSQQYLNFRPTLDAADRDAWVQILTEARKRPITLTVGPKNSKQPFESTVDATLNVYPPWTPVVIVLVVLLLTVLVLLGRNTALLREGNNDTPYSLGRVQMACWFYVVIAAYLYLWLTTGEYNNLNSSILTLIGISGATGLAAVFVGKDNTETAKALEGQETVLKARIDEIASDNPSVGSKLDQELHQKRITLADVQAKRGCHPIAVSTPISQGFWKDILRDGDGISLPRFQIVVWTIVFTSIFVRAVHRDLAMPELDGSLLGLMGISSGTYVGFKFPEKPK